jgi:hypothetical protein
MTAGNKGKEMTVKIEAGTFAEACYDQNSVDELIKALAGQADDADMKAWSLMPHQWRYEIGQALAAKAEDAGIEPDQDWENEATTWALPNGNHLVLSGMDVEVRRD